MLNKRYVTQTEQIGFDAHCNKVPTNIYDEEVSILHSILEHFLAENVLHCIKVTLLVYEGIELHQ